MLNYCEEQSDNVIIIHSHSQGPAHRNITTDKEEDRLSSCVSHDVHHHQQNSYVTQVTVSSMCLCCSGQQARRCSVNIDLQLAAELGNTLLERNKDLESTIKHQQAVIEDQIQEIEFLTKQTAALKEVNESRVRIYEQIEISLSELETNNLRLSEDSAAEKSKIRSLSTAVTALENRCEELQRSLEEAEIIIRNRKEKRNSIFLQENPNSDSLCLSCSKPNEKSSRKNSQIFFYEGGGSSGDQSVSPETLGIAALFVESLNCGNTNNSQQCKVYQDVASGDQQDLLETERSVISTLQEEAASERIRIRELEDQIETLLTEKAALVSSVRELKLKTLGVTENNNNHRHQQLHSDSSRLTLCSRCSVWEGEQEDPLNFYLPLLDGIWSLILSLLSPSSSSSSMSWLDLLLFSTCLAALLLGLVSSLAALVVR